MHCMRCGAPIPDNQQTCPTCGAPTGNLDAPLPPPAGTEVFGQQPEPQPQAYPPPTAQPVVPVSQPQAAPAQQPVTEQQAQPIQQPVSQPIVEQPAQPVPQPVSDQVQPASQPDPASTSPQQPAPQDAPEPVPPYAQASQSDQTIAQQPMPQSDQAAGQQPGQPMAFAPEPAPVAPQGPSPKKNRKPIIIAAAAVLVILLGVGGFFGYNAYVEHQRSETYQQAIGLMDGGDYQAALGLFTDLEDYEDSRNLADLCTKTIAFNDAEGLFESKDYAGARAKFAELDTFMDADHLVAVCDAWLLLDDVEKLTADGKFDEASQKAEGFSSVPEVRDSSEVKAWRNKNNYGIADQMYQDGQYYAAYTRFTSLGSYEDSAARAEACIVTMPDSGELYHNEGFVSSSTDVKFDAGDATVPHFIKVYSGDTLVSTVFVHAGSTATIQVPPGDYIFKSAWGSNWFGDEEMFGLEGTYSVMLFDGSSESVTLDGNMIYTITLYSVSGGNVGSRSLDAGSF